jgi:hypothetical protein
MEPVRNLEPDQASVELTLRTRRIGAIIWSSFLAASLGCVIVFAMLDPAEVRFFGNDIQLERTVVYTLGFILFWLVSATAAWLCSLLLLAPLEKK